MPTQQDLIDAIDDAIQSAIVTSYTTASAANDIFEAYVWSLLIAAAKSEGANVRYETVGGVPATQLVFRTSPGRIYSIVQQYTHAIIDFSSIDGIECPELEVHIGIYVTGKSGILHECDVAVLDRNEAIICRRQNVHPRNAKLLCAAECKFYAGTLPLGMARAFLGLTEDLTKSERFIVTNTSSSSAKKLVTYHKAEWEFELNLINPVISQNLQSRFSRIFRNYKAKHPVA